MGGAALTAAVKYVCVCVGGGRVCVNVWVWV